MRHVGRVRREARRPHAAGQPHHAVERLPAVRATQLDAGWPATLLADRRVLVIGGATVRGALVDSVEIAARIGSESRADLRLPAARAIRHAP